MTPTGQLAGAATRLRRPPGRPRSKPSLEEQAVAALSPAAPRLLDVAGAAAYLGGISPRTVHELRAAGHLRPVRLPLAGDRELRKLLFDRLDLDAFIEASKEPAR
jgi:hypothetical protein